jgi:DNA-binding response OmpR family regulator
MSLSSSAANNMTPERIPSTRKTDPANLRVLLIDQGLHSNETLQSILLSNGMDVQLVKVNGKEPKTYSYRNVDLIIFDSDALTTEGYQRCTRIRNSSPVPLLVLSALNHPEVIANMLDCGADDFITKPVSAEVLLAHIHKLTRWARLGLGI